MSATVVNTTLRDALLASAANGATQLAYLQIVVAACGSAPTFVAKASSGAQLKVWTIAPPTVSNDNPRRLAFADSYLAVTVTQANLPASATTLTLRDSQNNDLIVFAGVFARGLIETIDGEGFSGALFTAPSALPFDGSGGGGGSFPQGQSSDFTALLVPTVGDYELRQPVITANATFQVVPTSGQVFWLNNTIETLLTVGATLTPAQFKTLFYRPENGASAGQAGGVEYTVNAVVKRCSINKVVWSTMFGPTKARLRIFSAATAGTQEFEGLANLHDCPSDPLNRLKRGPLPSAIAGVGYQYCATGSIAVTAPVAKNGFNVHFQKWYTPSNGCVEIAADTWPSATGKWPLRTGSDALTTDPNARSLDFVEIDYLDGNDAVYTASGEKAGRLRGTTTGSNETRVRLSAGAYAWWWNKEAAITGVENNPNVLYAHRITPTMDALGSYQNPNGGGNIYLSPRFPVNGLFSGDHFGYMGPGDAGALTKTTSAGGQSQDREPWHHAEQMVLDRGPNAVRRFTSQGAETYGQIMRDVADCAVNGVPAVFKTHPFGGPLDTSRYPTDQRRIYLARSSGFGALNYLHSGDTGGISPFPTLGVVDLDYANTKHNGFQIDQAHLYTACTGAYALTGSVRYFFGSQFIPVAAQLMTNPMLRENLVLTTFGGLTNGLEPFYRSTVRPLMELEKSARVAPAYADGMWIDQSQLQSVVDTSWANIDAYFATEEASTDPRIRPAWRLGMRPFTAAVLQTTNFSEDVRPTALGTNQNNFPAQTENTRAWGWVNHAWDAAYAMPLFLMRKKFGRGTTACYRFMRKLLRYALFGALDCPQSVQRHPFIMSPRYLGSETNIPLPSAAWDSSNNSANPWASTAANNTPAWGGVELDSFVTIRNKRGEPDDSASGNIQMNASRTFTVHLWWQVMETIAREFPFIAAEPEFSARFDTGLAWYRRQHQLVKEALTACEAVYTPGQSHFLLTGRTDLATANPTVNQTQGAYYLSPGQMIMSLEPTGPSNPKVWTQNDTAPLNASSFTEVGRFKVPAIASGVNMTYANGGLALKTGGAEPEFYVLGNRAQSTEGYIVRCALIKAPATLAAPTVATVSSIPAATTLQATADALDGNVATKMFSVNGLGHAGNGINMLGIGYDQASEKLIISMAPFYGEAPAGDYAGTVFTRSANLTQTGTTLGPVKLGSEHPRRTPGPLVKIPTATATAWGVRPWASGGSAGLSVADTCAQGPNLHCFNPADITTAGATISTNVLANYYFTSDPSLRKTLSEAVGSVYDSIGNYSPAPGIIHSRKNDYWDWTSHIRGGPVFFESKQVVAFFGMVGTGRNSYRGDGTVTDPAMIWSLGGATAAAPVIVDDPANVVGNKPRGYPYKRRCIVVPYSEYQAVLANTKAPTDVVPSAVFDMPAHNLVLDKSRQGNQALPAGIEHAGYTVVGTALDTSVTPNRLYELYGGTDQLNGTFGDAIVRVYEVA
jgi:hypothetical protein